MYMLNRAIFPVVTKGHLFRFLSYWVIGSLEETYRLIKGLNDNFEGIFPSSLTEIGVGGLQYETKYL